MEEAELLLQQGFSRVESHDRIERIADLLNGRQDEMMANSWNLVVDRLQASRDEQNMSRMADSVQTAFFEGQGECIIKVYTGNEVWAEKFSNQFESDGITFEDPTEHMFSFNNPVGACPTCEGYGKVIGIDEDLVVPNKSLSVYQDTIVCWKGESMKKWKDRLIQHAGSFGFPIHKPYYELSPEQKRLLWTGNSCFKGIDAFFKMLEEKSYKIQYRVMLSRYRGKTTCPDCRGTRLKKEAGYIQVNHSSIQDLVLMPVNELREFFRNIQLTLNRLSSTLSGGESQRINLATSLGSSLVGSLYILDEPSIGLHSRDTQRLIKVLRKLQKIGNTVLVVEHDEEIIRAADEIIDIGPRAGIHGGELVFQGNHSQLLQATNSLTADYLNGTKKIEIPRSRRKWNDYIEVIGARENNLQNLTVKFPLNTITAITGVSGSGKSTLISKILYPGLAKIFGGYSEKTGAHDAIKGDINRLSAVEFVDQNPIGKSSRSNPVTYLKAYDEIRKLFADLPASKYQGFKPAHFSFNVDGGRCEECEGEGEIHVEMQFMADVNLVCESCQGKRFKEEILEVEYREKNIYDILEMTVKEAIDFFGSGKTSTERKIARKLQPLQDVGLDYVKLGQSSSTLSGGESQRVKLAAFLSKEKDASTLFIFDEPTTGLHFHDIRKLLDSFNALISRGHSIIVIEHNLDVVKCADWIIDLGPEGGKNGGKILFEGTPEDLIKNNNSYTGKALETKLKE
jgi:excinuclease ABC subunit A